MRVNCDLFEIATGLVCISLHTADPGEAGDQTTSEATYKSYARVSVARTTAGWTVTSGTCRTCRRVSCGTEHTPVSFAVIPAVDIVEYRNKRKTSDDAG
jgi:hypothetical protein